MNCESPGHFDPGFPRYRRSTECNNVEMARLAPTKVLLAAACAAAMVLAACGGDDGGSESVIDDAASEVATTTGTATDDTADDSATPTTTVFVPIGAELFDTDFAQVCRDTGQPAAAAYEPVAGVHPIVVMTSEDGVEFTGSYTTTLPDGWSVLYPDLASAELVLCQSVVSTTPTEVCTGYTDDDNPDAGESSVQMFDVTYELSVRVAATAEVLHTESVEASDEDCPMMVFFDEGDPDPKPWIPFIEDGVIELMVKPFVNPA